jgi:hypothetical protein
MDSMLNLFICNDAGIHQKIISININPIRNLPKINTVVDLQLLLCVWIKIIRALYSSPEVKR